MVEKSKGICILPLFDFESTMDTIDLGGEILIRRITRSEIKKIQEGREYPFHEVEIARINYTLEKQIDADVHAFDETISQFLNLVLAMRLFKQGLVGYKAGMLISEGKAFITHSYATQPRWPASKLPEFEKYPTKPLTFLEEDFREYCLFKDKVSKLGGLERNWPLSIRYFSRMCEDKPIEDILVDGMIAFEALVFKGEKRFQERGLSLALSISMLIGKNSEERDKIRIAMKNAYEVRNAVVHGNPPKVIVEKRRSRPMSPLEIHVLSWEVEDYLRRALRKLLFEES